MATQPKLKGRDYPLSPTPIPIITPVASENKIKGRSIVNIPAPTEGRAVVNTSAPIEGRAIVNKGQM